MFKKILLLSLLFGILCSVAYLLIAKNIFPVSERDAPIIEVVELPRGIGLAPVSISLKLTDNGSGLDEIVIRSRQRQATKELLRKKLGKQKTAEIKLEFNGNQTGLVEGMAEIEVRAFDASFWSNKQEIIIPIKIDYIKPSVEVISATHYTQVGGSQLVIFKANDQRLAVTGVKLANDTFIGFPAAALNEDFEDRNIFVAFYGVRANLDAKDATPRVFAEDQVGNATSKTYFSKVFNTSYPRQNFEISNDYLENQVRPIITSAYINDNPQQNFKTLMDVNCQTNDAEILKILKTPASERKWNGIFQRQAGTIRSSFGTKFIFKYQDQEIAQGISTGYEFMMPGNSTVIAANSGTVVFVGNLGCFGNTVIIDHGLGISTVYGYLSEFSVSAGSDIATGEAIGTAGMSGLARGKSVFFQQRTNGIPIDSREWWDQTWYDAHINKKLKDTKYSLGISFAERF